MNMVALYACAIPKLTANFCSSIIGFQSAAFQQHSNKNFKMTATNKINEPEDSENEELCSYEEDTDMEAYIQLNKALDEISNCLDALEQKNDSLHAEITKLLEESRQIRSEIKKSESSS